MIEFAYGVLAITAWALSLTHESTRKAGSVVFWVWAGCWWARRLGVPLDVFYTVFDAMGLVTLTWFVRTWIGNAIATLLAVQIVLHWTTVNPIYVLSNNSLFIVQCLIVGVTGLAKGAVPWLYSRWGKRPNGYLMEQS